MPRKRSRETKAENPKRSRPKWSRRPSARKPKRGQEEAEKKEKGISPSQVATFRECERKWAFDKIDRLPRKPNKYAKIGLDTHKELERWLDEGRPPNARNLAGRIALAGLHALPKPGIAKTERYVRFRYNGVIYHGYVDAWWVHTERPLLFLHDHKTTGDFQWAKSARDLLGDPQFAVYAFGLLLSNPEFDEVVGRWQYHLRRPTRKGKIGPKHRAKLVELRQTRTQVKKLMEGVHETGLKIMQARKEPSSARPRNFSHCKAYGGCDYIDVCHRGVHARDKLRGIMAKSKAVQMLKEREAKGKSVKLPIIDVDAVREAKAPPKKTKKKGAKKTSTKQMELPLDAKTRTKKTKKTAKRKSKGKVVWTVVKVKVALRESGEETLLKVKFTDGTSHVVPLSGVSPEDLVRG